MASTADVLKPDFEASRKHFIFTEDHDRLRESIHAATMDGAGQSDRDDHAVRAIGSHRAGHMGRDLDAAGR